MSFASLFIVGFQCVGLNQYAKVWGFSSSPSHLCRPLKFLFGRHHSFLFCQQWAKCGISRTLFRYNPAVRLKMRCAPLIVCVDSVVIYYVTTVPPALCQSPSIYRLCFLNWMMIESQVNILSINPAKKTFCRICHGVSGKQAMWRFYILFFCMVFFESHFPCL